MKLDIIGSVASGKTTLAKELSAQYQMRKTILFGHVLQPEMYVEVTRNVTNCSGAYWIRITGS